MDKQTDTMTMHDAWARSRNRRRRALAVLPSLLLLLGGCTQLHLQGPLRIAEQDWTTEGGAASRTHEAREPMHPPLEEAWVYNAEGAFGRAPALVAEGTLLVVTRKGDIHALDVQEGRKLGATDLGEVLEGTPVLTERVIYAPVGHGAYTLVAYDFTKGRAVWRRRLGPVQAGLLRTGNALVVAALDGTVRHVAMADGRDLWTTTPDSTASLFASPTALGDDLIAVADDRGRVTALDIATGAVRWAVELERPVYETPAASGDLLFVPTTRGRFYALEARNGAVRWAVEAEDARVRFAAPAVVRGHVYVGGTDGRLRALDAATGAERWHFETDGVFGAAPLVAGDVVYVGAMDEHLYALDRETGALLWETEVRGRIKSAPVLRHGLLFVFTEPHHVVAFRAVAPVAARPEDS